MLFLEHIAAAKRNIKLQVFASDIDADCIAFARNGIWPESIEADVTPSKSLASSPKRTTAIGWCANCVRRSCSPVRACWPTRRSHVSISSPAAICSSIWARRRSAILSLFHFALREDGVLFLGSSETVGNVSDRFEPISKKHRNYRHIGRSGRARSNSRVGPMLRVVSRKQPGAAGHATATARFRRAIAASAARSLCARLRPDQRQARGPLLLLVRWTAP